MSVEIIDFFEEEDDKKPTRKEPEPVEDVESSHEPRLLRKQVITIEGTIVDVEY